MTKWSIKWQQYLVHDILWLKFFNWFFNNFCPQLQTQNRRSFAGYMLFNFTKYIFHSVRNKNLITGQQKATMSCHDILWLKLFNWFFNNFCPQLQTQNRRSFAGYMLFNFTTYISHSVRNKNQITGQIKKFGI